MAWSVVTSRMLQTNATRLDDVLVDAPYFPDELAALTRPAALLVTHSHWDHVLARLAFPDVPLHAARATAERLGDETRAELEAFDAEHYVERDGPLRLEDTRPLDVPGTFRGLELIPTAGHVPDGLAAFDPEDGVLCAGDYLSPVEIPLVSRAGSRTDYVATLHRLAPWVERASAVVPGHGRPLGRDEALTILEEDLAYLEAPFGRIPPGRDTVRQREIHADNRRKHG